MKHSSSNWYSFRISVTLILLTSLSSFAVENATVVRERDGAIKSVYYDLRLPYGDVRAGLPPQWPHALATVGIDYSTVTWADQSINTTPPGTPVDPNRTGLEEKRVTASALYQQSLWTPFPWDALIEFEAQGTSRSADNGANASTEMLVGDPRAQLLFPLWQERYAGVLFGGGVSAPLGEQDDWLNAHDSFGGIVSLRWSGLIPAVSWLSFSVSSEYRFVPSATQRIYLQQPSAESVDCDYRGYTVGGRITARVLQRLAVSLSASGREDRWGDILLSGATTTIDERIRRIGYGAHLTFTYSTSAYWTLTTRYDVPDDQADPSFAAGINVAFTIW